jgi:hypothetical protein
MPLDFLIVKTEQTLAEGADDECEQLQSSMA